jgi:hypothetical protein
MTDETELAATPAEEPIVAPESKEPEPESKEPEVKTEEPVKEPEGEEPEEKKKLSGSERLKRQKARLAEELAAERARREELEKKLSGAPSPDAKPGIDREPREEDFPNDYFAFERAKTAWEVRQAIRAEREQEDSVRRQARSNEARMELVDEYAEHVETVRERIPDYDQVVNKANRQIPDELADEILAAGSKAPLITYYLAQNPQKLEQLVNLSGKALAREVGRIEAKVHLPQAKKATEASPPPSIPKGGAAPAFDPFKTDDMDAYVKWRQAGGGKK